MTEVYSLALSQIIPGRNDRTTFEPKALADLAASIRDNGLAQPITVRPGFVCEQCESFRPGFVGDQFQIEHPDHCPACGHESTYFGAYQIVAGERRFRACQSLGWAEIPAIVRPLSDEQAAAIMLAENTSRADLDPIDEGQAYQARIDAYGWTVADCARQAGVSEVRIQFRLKLLRLTPYLQDLVRRGNLPLGYAQTIADAGLEPARQQIAVNRLNANPHPTPGWFRQELARLVTEQDQTTMFEDLPLLGETPAAIAPSLLIPEPPHPTTSQPPVMGRTIKDILSGQAAFWQDAADAWDRLGKPFKKQECRASAQALQLALAAI
jgi:ParB/RepB/Spo0J family partition protein